MRPAAQDLHKGSQNLHAALKRPAKAGLSVKGVRREDGPVWYCTPPLADYTAGPPSVTRNERTADGYFTDPNSHRDFGFLLDILHLPLSVTPRCVFGPIDLTTD